MTEAIRPAPPPRGVFVTFEGGEGSGKSTQISRAADFLRRHGREVVVTREPGGSPGADALRHVLLSGAAREFGEEVETILFAAARADHLATLIAPALARGQDVLCDRFHDSTRVYQGLAERVPAAFLARLEEATLDGLYPDLTILLDVPAEEGLRRAAARRGTDEADRFEVETIEIHETRRQAFLAIAEEEPLRCSIVDATLPVDEVASRVAAILAERLALPVVESDRQEPDLP